MSKSNVEIIGRRLGSLLALETSPNEGLCLSRGFLRVHMGINISQPLSKGFWLWGKIDTSNERWVSFKYEKLPDFCYACGRIGQDNRGCRFVSKEVGDSFGYGLELRTRHARKGPIPIEIICAEVDEAEIRV